MRVVLVNKFWYPKGGAEQVLFLTKQLLEEAGHTVEVFGMHHPQNSFKNEFFVDEVDYDAVRGVKKLIAAKNSIYNTKAKKQFGKLLDSFQPDVVHIHNIYHQLSYSILDSAKERGIPVVMTLHDYQLVSPNYLLFHHGKRDTSMVAGKYYRCLLHNCMENPAKSFIATLEVYFRAWKQYNKKIRLFIAPSLVMKRMVERGGILANKIQVIHNPISAEDFEDFSFVYGSYVLYVGRLSAEKGIDLLLKVAAQTPEIEYRIAGTGPLATSIEKRKTDNVKLLGFLEGGKLREAYKQARFVVCPSIWLENAPMSIVEANAHGKVVVGSKIGGIVEMIEDEFLVPVGNTGALAEKINEIWNMTANLLESKGVILRKLARQKYDSKKYVESLLEIYISLKSK